MKKMLSLLTVAALLAQSADMQAMDRAQEFGRKARAAFGRGAKRAGEAFGTYVGAPTQASGAKLAAWAGPFLSDVGKAIQTGDFQALPGIADKYKAQARIAGGVIAVALVGAVIGIARLLTREDADVSRKVASVAKKYGVDLRNKINRNFLNAVEQKNIIPARWEIAANAGLLDTTVIDAAMELADEETRRELVDLKGRVEISQDLEELD